MISVIVPVYNSGQYLWNCLSSIAEQTYTDLEIICVNDGSTDNSADILKEFSQQDHRFHVVNQENLGVSAARNRGLELARGEFITFVDSDDEIEPIMYQTLLDLADMYDADITHCGYKKIELDRTARDIGGTSVLLVQNAIESIRCLITGKYFVGGTCTKLYRHTLISQIKFDENLKINEDVLFNFEAFYKSKCNVFYDVPLYHYYERDGSSCSRTKHLKKSLDCLRVAEQIYETCLNTELKKEAANKLFNNLTGSYRAYLFSDRMNSVYERKEIANRIKDILPVCEIQQKYRLNYYFMHAFPGCYKFLYKIYNNIRTPNWDL